MITFFASGFEGFLPWPAPAPANATVASAPTASTAAPKRPNLFNVTPLPRSPEM